ncbi:hypothetical protein LWI29_015267 [Acer saccharum]|uniref:Uncharacterized protein n=1 Tax=Acer saccharum TaxID=4024 RepID=A0AA39RCV1_ACESA|nr:hypothetical protein LWI29_015267 [Acer saccharum]
MMTTMVSPAVATVESISITSSNSLYEVMRVDPTASMTEIKTAYRSLAKVAAARGHVQVVKFLVCMYPRGCVHKDINGRNPIHISAMNGYTDIIQKILHTRRDSATILTRSEGTILHLCIKFNQYESFKLLVENDPDSVSFKDVDHNIVLHMAVSQKQAKVY